MSFDAASFLSQTTSGPMSTEIENCPEGEFPAIIDDFGEEAFRSVETKNGDSTIVRIPFVIQDEAVKAKLGRDKVIVAMDFWLDTDDSGSISTETNKNVKLGQLREALGQNTGKAWNFGMLRGAGPVVVKVSHRADKNDPKINYAEVKRVSKIR